MSSELTTLTNRLLSEVGPKEPLPLDEELRHARLVAEGKRVAKRLAEPGLPEEERRRLEAAATEGRVALTTLVAHNLPLVVRMTRRYRWSGVPVLDLFQEGVLGLLQAAERFDWTRGVPFGAYASWWVRHAMSKAVRDATTSVRLSDDAKSSLRRLAKQRDADRGVSWRVLAERAGVDADEAEDLLPLLGPPLSRHQQERPQPPNRRCDLAEDLLLSMRRRHPKTLSDRQRRASVLRRRNDVSLRDSHFSPPCAYARSAKSSSSSPNSFSRRSCGGPWISFPMRASRDGTEFSDPYRVTRTRSRVMGGTI